MRTPPRRGFQGLGIRLVRGAAVIYLCWFLVLSGCQTSLVFPRHVAGPALPEAAMPRGIERIWVPSGGDPASTDKVEAWVMRPATLAPGERAPMVMLFHGNAELIDHFTDYAEWYTARGFIAVIPEYRGYGRSGGTPGERAIVEDMTAFYDTVIGRPDVDRSQVVFHGRSLGSAVGVQLAARRKPSALVLESPFLSVTAFASRYFVPSFAVKHPFRTDRVLPTLGKPVLILSSGDDEIVPASHGRALAERTPGAEFIELSGGHNSGLSHQGEYWPAVEKFIHEHLVP